MMRHLNTKHEPPGKEDEEEEEPPELVRPVIEYVPMMHPGSESDTNADLDSCSFSSLVIHADKIQHSIPNDEC